MKTSYFKQKSKSSNGNIGIVGLLEKMFVGRGSFLWLGITVTLGQLPVSVDKVPETG